MVPYYVIHRVFTCEDGYNYKNKHLVITCML